MVCFSLSNWVWVYRNGHLAREAVDRERHLAREAVDRERHLARKS